MEREEQGKREKGRGSSRRMAELKNGEMRYGASDMNIDLHDQG